MQTERFIRKVDADLHPGWMSAMMVARGVLLLATGTRLASLLGCALEWKVGGMASMGLRSCLASTHG